MLFRLARRRPDMSRCSSFLPTCADAPCAERVAVASKSVVAWVVDDTAIPRAFGLKPQFIDKV